MVCRRCDGKPAAPLVRRGYPTVWAFGPFKDHVAVEYTEENDVRQEEGNPETTDPT